MKTLITLFAVATFSFTSAGAKDGRIKLDHVIIAVQDLDAAKAHFSVLGFRLKDGSLHANGLLNAHIEFADHSEIELMSLTGEAGDAIAQGYQRFLTEGEGGAYVAFSGMSATRISALLTSATTEHILTSGKFWSYITFPESSGLEHIFFVEQHGTAQRQEYNPHPNGAAYVSAVDLQGTEALARLFLLFGAAPCEAITKDTECYKLGRTEFRAQPYKAGRPRVRTIQLKAQIFSDGTSERALLGVTLVAKR